MDGFYLRILLSLLTCFIYVSSGAGCVEKADILYKSPDTKKQGEFTGKSGWKWSTRQFDQFFWGYMIMVWALGYERSDSDLI